MHSAPEGLGVVYVYTDPKGRSCAIAYAGKRSKSSWHHAFANEQQMLEKAAEFFLNLKSWKATKAEWRATRMRPHTLKAGDIVHHSWGWEQTQCDYYQVVSATPHTVNLRAIASETVPGSIYEHGMAELRTAVKDAFCGDEFRVHVNGNNAVGLEHGSAGLWDGKPDYCSWYA